MCKVICICNQKGGVAKTTSTVNLGVGLAMEGKRVLLIDDDPQGSLTASLGYVEPDDIKETLATVMMNIINEEDFKPREGILHHMENVDLLPANIELSALELTMASVVSREMILREYVEMMRAYYDYILIDCMPSLGIMTINALAAADSVIIPVQAAYLPVKGLQQLMYSFIYIPKFLMTERTFSSIQNTSKIIYGFLMDRMKMSIKNQWIDDKGRVYLIYPMNELEKDVGMSRKRIVECLQELQEAGLLEQDGGKSGHSGIMYLKHISEE